MYLLSIKPRALKMMQSAYLWYEEQKEGLGEEFLEELDAIYKKVLSNPTHYGKIKRNYRKAALSRFPFVVVYELFKKEIVVFAVFYTRRNPRRMFRN